MEIRSRAGCLVSLLLALACSSLPAAEAASAASAGKEEPVSETAQEQQTAGRGRIVVDIQGVEGELLQNIRAYLKIFRKRDDPAVNDLWIRHLHEKAPEEIRKALQPFGYYNPVIEARLEQQEDGSWKAIYRIDPGPETRIAHLDLKWLGEGAGEAALQVALDDFPLKQGDVLDHQAYEKGKTALMELADSLGYPDVEARVARVTVDPEHNRASITLHLDTGKKYYIGDIRLHQDVLDEDFVWRYLVDVKSGDVYSQDNLQGLQRELIETGYFSLVEILPRFKEAREQKVPVDVKLEPAKRQRWSFGIGYDTDILFNLSTRWTHRRLNRRGHKADALLKLSQKEARLRGTYWIPVKDPRTTKLGFTAELSSDYGYDDDRVTLDLEAGYYFLWEKWISELFVQYKYEQFTSGAGDFITSNLLSIGGRAERSNFASGVYPRSGWYLWGDLRGSPGLVSSTDYLRAHLKTRLFFPLAENGRINLRAEAGSAAVGDFDKYPNSLRFFAGGDSSVRGWDWKDIGPEDVNGLVIGGRHVLTGTLEYDHRVAEQWVAAAFVDAGNAFNDWPDKFYYGAGAGVRWLSPVGSVRVDLAWPFNKDNDEDTRLSDIHVHFGIEVNL
ncbi:autotransporter assembly complex protein TamA [Thiolapillus sp.]